MLQKNLARVSFVLSEFTRLIDGRTAISLVAIRPAVHNMKCVNKGEHLLRHSVVHSNYMTHRLKETYV